MDEQKLAEIEAVRRHYTHGDATDVEILFANALLRAVRYISQHPNASSWWNDPIVYNLLSEYNKNSLFIAIETAKEILSLPGKAGKPGALCAAGPWQTGPPPTENRTYLLAYFPGNTIPVSAMRDRLGRWHRADSSYSEIDPVKWARINLAAPEEERKQWQKNRRRA